MNDSLKDQIARDFAEVINKHSLECYSNTPDFVIADYLVNCLDAYNKVVYHRNSWYANGNGNWPINSNEPNNQKDY